MAPSAVETKIRILVVEDEKTILSFMRMGLEFSGYEVEVSEDGRQALDLYQKRKPDMVILDVGLPGLNGWEVCKRLRELGDVPIIMVTVFDSTDDKVRGLVTGADDYLAKPFDFNELLARIKAVLRRRKSQVQGTELSFGDIVLRRDTHDVFRNGVPVDLTSREFDLLEFFMRHPRQLLSRDAILNRLWGDDFVGDANIVDVYVSHLRRKLGDPQVIRTVRSGGFALRME